MRAWVIRSVGIAALLSIFFGFGLVCTPEHSIASAMTWVIVTMLQVVVVMTGALVIFVLIGLAVTGRWPWRS